MSSRKLEEKQDLFVVVMQHTYEYESDVDGEMGPQFVYKGDVC